LSGKCRCVFGGMALVTESEKAPEVRKPLTTSVDRGHRETFSRYTVGRVIPWWVARPQSPPPFHPAEEE
jgi:hypothetical protein